MSRPVDQIELVLRLCEQNELPLPETLKAAAKQIRELVKAHKGCAEDAKHERKRAAEYLEEFHKHAKRADEAEAALAIGAAEKARLRSLLYDVVSELDLSDGMAEKHGPLGTEPAKLAREVLDRKDMEIQALRNGFVDVERRADLARVTAERDAMRPGVEAMIHGSGFDVMKAVAKYLADKESAQANLNQNKGEN